MERLHLFVSNRRCYHPDMLRYAVLSMGEAAGTSPEIILRTVIALSATPDAGLIVTGDRGVFERIASDLSLVLPFGAYIDSFEALTEAEGRGERLIFFISSSIDMRSFCYGVPSAETGRASYRALETAVDIIQNGFGQSLVTCPVSNVSLREAGYDVKSVHEMLRRFAQTDRLVNMVNAGKINAFGLTHRRSVRSALDKITRENVIEALIKIDALKLSSYFDKELPIAVGALNPQDGDGEWLGTEERDAIIPAVTIAKSLGIDVEGPIAAEELFSRSARGEFAAILVMTAGEAFAACGAASPDEMLIISWGLPFLRIGLPGDAGLRQAGRGEASLRGMIRAVGEALILRDSSFMV